MVVLFEAMSREGAVVVESDHMPFGLRALDLARELNSVTRACRVFGIHRSTYYRWKEMVERSRLEMLRPRERPAPLMPNYVCNGPKAYVRSAADDPPPRVNV